MPWSVAPPLFSVLQEVPFQRRMVPPSPTAQTLVALLPQTALSCAAPTLLVLQVLPFQWRIVPPLPTAQTSEALLPQTPWRSFPVDLGFCQHHSPPQLP